MGAGRAGGEAAIFDGQPEIERVSPAPCAGRTIVDAHHHVWDPAANNHPWLRQEPLIPFRYGDYSAIRRRYSPADFRADAAPFTLAGSVYVEAEWDPADPAGEMDYIAGLRAETGLPSVAVAQAWLDRADVAAVLESHAIRPFVRSVRHKPRANATAQETTPGGMADPLWRDGFARLAPLGLRFDLQTPWWHLCEAWDLAMAFPDTSIILNHAGLPADRSPEGLAGWRAAMACAADAPNVSVKISGLGQRGKPWTADANRAIVLAIIEMFGVERCMFASNFPVDSLCGTFGDIFGGFQAIVQDFPDAEQEALFVENARRIYAMGESA